MRPASALRAAKGEPLGPLEAILANTATEEADAITLEEIIRRAKTSRSTSQRVLKELVSVGRIREIGTGKRKNAFRYFRPEKVSAQTSSSCGQKETRSPAYVILPRSTAEPGED